MVYREHLKTVAGNGSPGCPSGGSKQKRDTSPRLNSKGYSEKGIWMERDPPLGKMAQIKGKQGLSLFYIKWKCMFAFCLLTLSSRKI